MSKPKSAPITAGDEKVKEYDDGRIWYRIWGVTTTVGLTEKGLAEVGSIQSVTLPQEGDEFLQDEVLVEIEGDQGSFEVIAPMDGVIVEVNEILIDDFDPIERDSLDAGWLFRLENQETSAQSDEEE